MDVSIKVIPVLEDQILTFLLPPQRLYYAKVQEITLFFTCGAFCALALFTFLPPTSRWIGDPNFFRPSHETVWSSCALPPRLAPLALRVSHGKVQPRPSV